MRRDRLIPVTALAGALMLAGVGVAAYATKGEDAATRYRLASATTSEVEQTLVLSGTVDAADRADVAFAVDGTVARLLVRQGQKVRAGQVIATLERNSLQATLTQAVATLAQARAQLETDESAQADTVSTASTSTGTTSTQPTTQPDPQASDQTDDGSAVTEAIGAALASLKVQQAAVATAQSAVSTALSEGSTALEAQTAACATAFEESAPDEGEDADDSACSDALAVVQAKQQATSDAETALSQALNDLTSTLSTALAEVKAAAGAPDQAPVGPSTSQPSASQTSASQPSATQPSASQTSASSAAPSAARLAADQAAIDQASADLLSARKTLAQTRVVAPMAGRVAVVAASRGDGVTAGDAAATLVAGHGVLVETSAGETSIRQVKVGQTVHVTPVGSVLATDGVVTAIGLTADTSSGSAAYAVTVAVAQPKVPLPTGSQATVEIVTGSARAAVTVPISAVTRGTDSASVRVLSAGLVSTQRVTLGIVGSTTVQVTDGLSDGAQVVLADLDQAVTGAGTETGGSTFTGPPGMTGAGGGAPPGMGQASR